MDMIDVIANYLRDNRRLVIPTFGAFVVKESGEVLFSELLKTDDGVLRGLLSAGGLSELECAGMIDRFIFDVRNALSESGRFDMGDLGRFMIGANGDIRFVSPIVKPVEKIVEKPVAANPVQPAKTVVSKPDTFRAKTQPERERPKVATASRRCEPRKRGVDWFVVVAVFVLLAAVAVIVYGYFCSAEQNDEAMMDSLRWQIEQPASDNK